MASLYSNFIANNGGIEIKGKDLSLDSNTFYKKDNPFNAKLIFKKQLNYIGSGKETLHIELSLKNSGIKYLPGDSIGVYSKNTPAFADAIIEKLGFDKYEPVWILQKNRSIRYALIEELEITRLRPDVVSAYSSFSDIPELIALEEDEIALSKYCQRRDLLDLITEFPADITAQELCSILKKLPPRLYSIASSLEANPDEVHLTIGVVRYEKNNRTHEGVCSTFLNDRIDPDVDIPIYVRPSNNFRLPEDGNVPVIMIGPGTGVAPFRAFMQQRIINNDKGKNWLFFGDRHKHTDYLYGDEWETYHTDGSLSKLSLAFSRDRKEKVYVQHKMLEESKEFFKWLEAGAHIYICGDKINMAEDVRRALLNIIIKEGKLSVEKAYEYISNMKENKRFQEDVY